MNTPSHGLNTFVSWKLHILLC